MNQDSDDKLVSAEYRAIANERVPAELDAAVLKEARTAMSGLQEFTASWFRPLAFVATLALSLALLLELMSTPSFEPARSPEIEAGRREAESFEADPRGAPRATSEFRKNADAPVPADRAATTKVGRTAESANAPAVDENASADFAEMIEATSKKMPGADGVTQNAIQGLKQSRPEAGIRLEEADPFRASAVVSDSGVRPCNEEQTADPERWWKCIADLEEAGRHDEAKAELDLFETAHPDFEAPETLPSK